MAEERLTGHGRQLGAELRRRRELAGYNGSELAARLGWSPSTVSRLEHGHRQVAEAEIAIYLASCGVPREQADPILNLAREARNDHHVNSHHERLPDELRTLIFHETTADTIDSYEPIFLPGLVQTEDYARALFREGGWFSRDGIELRVRARMDRQSLLKRRDPPQCTFFIHENPLRMRVGSGRIMHEQLLHLVFLTSRPQCAIRVVPARVGARGLANGSFQRMTYAMHDPVVYVQQDAVSVFLDSRIHTDYYQKYLDRLATGALDEGQSRTFLADLANEYDRSEENPNERDRTGLDELA